MELITKTKCTIHGCSRTFQERSQAELHSANTWHCLACGFSDGKELNDDNIGSTCYICIVKMKTLDEYFSRTSGSLKSEPCQAEGRPERKLTCKLLVFVDFKAKKRILYIRR